jgi:hypothetical protein
MRWLGAPASTGGRFVRMFILALFQSVWHLNRTSRSAPRLSFPRAPLRASTPISWRLASRSPATEFLLGHRVRRCRQIFSARNPTWWMAWSQSDNSHVDAKSIRGRRSRSFDLGERCPGGLANPCGATGSEIRSCEACGGAAFPAWCLDLGWKPSSLSVLPHRLHQPRDLSS